MIAKIIIVLILSHAAWHCGHAADDTGGDSGWTAAQRLDAARVALAFLFPSEENHPDIASDRMVLLKRDEHAFAVPMEQVRADLKAALRAKNRQIRPG